MSNIFHKKKQLSSHNGTCVCLYSGSSLLGLETQLSEEIQILDRFHIISSF